MTNRRNNDDKKAFDAKKFAWLDRLSRDTDISHLQFRLAYLIGSHLNSATGDAWPSQEYLATALDVTIRAVQVNSQAIAERGYLRIEVGTGRGNTNRYAPILEPANEALEPEKGESRFAFMDAKRRTATQEKANPHAIKGERPFVQNPLKNPLKNPLGKTRSGNGKGKTSFPSDFSLGGENLAFALQAGFDNNQVKLMFDKFKYHNKAKGNENADWDSAWQGWVTNQLDRDAKAKAEERRQATMRAIDGRPDRAW